MDLIGIDPTIRIDRSVLLEIVIGWVVKWVMQLTNTYYNNLEAALKVTHGSRCYV